MVKVLWIAFPQLETQEFKQASKILGYHPYGTTDVFTKNHSSAWNKHILHSEEMDWASLFENYDTALEVPSFLFYRDILKHNPNLKVIILDIDSRLSYNRYKRLKKFLWWSGWVRLFKRPREYMKMVDRAFYLLFKGNDSFINAQVEYTQFIEEVKNTVPTNQLLIFQPSDGWQPLCDFLGKEVPTQKFPAKYDSSKMTNTTQSIIISIIRQDAFLFIIYVSILIGLFTYLLFFY